MHVRLHASEWGVMRHGKIDVVVWIQTQVRVTAATVSSDAGLVIRVVSDFLENNSAAKMSRLSSKEAMPKSLVENTS
ncbi:hypothetical protein NDU88_002567 [Pleurodeles waltl]|uniref:Uncharacterized protein n=1 Tax=Pleurodeles waltl TaxID=8319 RepID=A0AAV7WLK3_PLEWA|nr:hypothetical protein NDU88_002567 [Pleurodeles waltl]